MRAAWLDLKLRPPSGSKEAGEMSDRNGGASAAARGRRRAPGLAGPGLALLALTWIGAPCAVRADTIVLNNGEALEGAIIDATRNTVVVQRAIGGMRQMPLREIAEVRVDLARGERISGQLLSWADGVYELRSGGETVRISAGNVVSRAPAEVATAQPRSNQPSRPVGPQTVRMAAAPPSAPDEKAAAGAPPAREQAAAREGGGAARTPSAGEDQVPAAEEDEGRAAAAGPHPAVTADRGQPSGKGQSPPAGADQRMAAAGEPGAPAAARGQAPIERRAPAADQTPSPPARAGQTPAAEKTPSPPADGEQSVAARADRSPSAGEKPSPESDQSPSAGAKQRMAAVGENRTPAAAQAQTPAAGEKPSAAANQRQSPPAREERSVAALSEGQPPAIGGKQGLAIKASVDPAASGADSMVFRIELSRPAEQTLVLIYGTVEGTAKAGKDFESQQGMVTLAPGTKSAEVRVPLIEQSTSGGEKSFELFLAADPKVAEVVDKRVVATISGGD
jgi:RNase P/RNase MRP subunit p29